jgi:hypothetical protein
MIFLKDFDVKLYLIYCRCFNLQFGAKMSRQGKVKQTAPLPVMSMAHT